MRAEPEAIDSGNALPAGKLLKAWARMSRAFRSRAVVPDLDVAALYQAVHDGRPAGQERARPCSRSRMTDANHADRILRAAHQALRQFGIRKESGLLLIPESVI